MLPCFPWPRLLSCSIAVCVLRQTVMCSRLCWTLLALAYFCINPFLLPRSSNHPALKSLKSTAFLCHHILFPMSSPSGRNSWAESCTATAKQSFLHYSCVHSTRVLEQVIIILFHLVQACSYMDTMSISCSLRNPVFSVCVCMYALSAISKLDLMVWLEIRYWALFFHTFFLMISPSFSCLSSLISLPYAVFAFPARTWLKYLLSHLLHKHIFCFSVCG